MSYIESQFCVTFESDITNFKEKVKNQGLSFTMAMVYAVCKCANEIEEFRYRFLDGKIVLYDRVDTAFTYVTVIMLVLDPIYLCLLSGAFGGGDVNGILYLMPQAWVWMIFAFILLFNIWILLKKVNPTYTASFKER